ncbi:hypothetical protein FKM82_025203 [Ascaphus truei]
MAALTGSEKRRSIVRDIPQFAHAQLAVVAAITQRARGPNVKESHQGLQFPAASGDCFFTWSQAARQPIRLTDSHAAKLQQCYVKTGIVSKELGHREGRVCLCREESSLLH